MFEYLYQRKHPLDDSKECAAGRTIKAIIFLVCLIGFIYQAIEFGTHFLTYPAVVHFDVKNLETFQLPAITFCNTNPVQRSKFCKKYPGKCETPKDMLKFCSEFPLYCQEDISNFKMPKVEIQSESLKYPFGLKESDIMELHQNTSEFDVTTTWTNDHEFIKNSSRNLQRFFLSAFRKEFHLCYTDNDLYVNKLEPIYKQISGTFAMYLLDVQPSESFRAAEKLGIRMAIHSPFESTDPFVKGIPLSPGNAYKISIRLEEELLLPYPYKTDCFDYYDFWIKSGKTEPRSQQMCRDKCQRIFNKACYDCEKDLAVYMETDKVCPLIEDIPCNVNVSKETLLQILDSCKIHCKKNCMKIKYHYSYVELPETFLEVLNLILVKIAVESPEAKVLTHIPKYQNIEIFSYIGGFMGCWMGFSIWTMTTSIDTVLRLLKMNRRRNISTSVEDLENK